MEVFVHGIPHNAAEPEIHDYFERILHSPPLADMWKLGYQMNFKLSLHRRRARSRSTTGTLQLPDAAIALALIDLAARRAFSPIYGSLVRMIQSKNLIDPRDVDALRQVPYQDPVRLRERAQLEGIFSANVPTFSLQFGWLDRDQVFSAEWTRSYGSEYRASIRLDPIRREILIEELGGIGCSYIPRRVVIRYGNVETLSISDAQDPQPAVLFTLRGNPVFEELSANEVDPISGRAAKRLRRASMHCEHHLAIASYTSRAILVSFERSAQLETFMDLVSKSSLPRHTTFLAIPERRGHFSSQLLNNVNRLISCMRWEVAFQVEALIAGTVITPKELINLWPNFDELARKYHEAPGIAGEMILAFGFEVTQMEWYTPSHSSQRRIDNALKDCFRRATADASRSFRLRDTSDDITLCYHLEVTPTSKLLQGPYPDQTNRVLRRYKEHQDHFLRVSFKDEDKLDFRFERDVDGVEFVQQHVGAILKNPLKVAGRSFEFLAYSNSALKEHAVWFVTRFTDERDGVVSAESIRRSLGNFDKVIRCPARFGARMSQAFTSTNVSITITAEEIVTIPDIVNAHNVNFTDGIGACSRATMDSIASALRHTGSQRRSRRLRAKFGAVQIRLGGNKGMLSVDHRLTETGTIYIRPSMNKFTSPSLDVEVADTFERPKPMFLNRPLIMILETLGVPIASFCTLQEAEIFAVTTAVEDFSTCAQLLDTHGLGASFRLPSVFLNLVKLGLNSPPEDDGFLTQGLDYAVNDVLRALKHRARIPVPQSYTLVGIADVHKYLKEGEIFVSVRDTRGRKTYLHGNVVITRSPAIHPGDVQMAWAIGKPPLNSPFEKEDHPNCVVFATQGQRSLPQSLGGGDLDGDLYNIIQCESLFPREIVEPGAYPPVQLRELPEGQVCNINHVADFIVDYINNDHLGMISVQNLIIADRSDLMSKDPDCIRLAELHSVAVDFQKSGIPADIRTMPRAPTIKPDWTAGEVVRDSLDFYESRRALGVLFRGVELPPIRARRQHTRELDDLASAFETSLVLNDHNLHDTISILIMEELEQRAVPLDLYDDLAEDVFFPQFKRYARDLRFICANYSLTSRPLTEEECWAGTITARSSQHRRRNDLQARMREECTGLVDQVREDLSTPDDLEEWLARTWVAWKVSRMRKAQVFGAKSYGYIVLGSLFEATRAMDRRDYETYDYP